jgi:hypothetical protein
MDANKGFAYIYSHLVCASKFAMVQVAHNLLSASCEGIKCILTVRKCYLNNDFEIQHDLEFFFQKMSDQVCNFFLFQFKYLSNQS